MLGNSELIEAQNWALGPGPFCLVFSVFGSSALSSPFLGCQVCEPAEERRRRERLRHARGLSVLALFCHLPTVQHNTIYHDCLPLRAGSKSPGG